MCVRCSVTPQNEPTWQPADYECCIYSAENYRDWVGQYLGPVLKAAYPDMQIMVWVS